MGIFGNAGAFDEDVDKATSETNTTEQWAVYLDLCDRVQAGGANAARDVLRAVLRRLGHHDPHVAIQAAALLDVAANNCGRPFLLELASRRSVDALARLVRAQPEPTLRRKLADLLRGWARDWADDPQLDLLPKLYQQLRREGLCPDPAPDAKPRRDPAAANAALEQQDLARAIALSLQDAPAPAAASAAAPVAAPAPAPAAARQVRALYDFEAAEDNELTFLAGESVFVTDSGDPNWWKGYNARGEGLFPANFVTEALDEAPESASRAAVTCEPEECAPPTAVIDEAALDAALAALHDADPEDDTQDSHDMRRRENHVLSQGPLVDAALQRADRRHATLTQLSADLVDALNLYHSLMREPKPVTAAAPPAMPPHLAMHPQMYGYMAGSMPVPNNNMPGALPVSGNVPMPANVPTNMPTNMPTMPTGSMPAPNVGMHPPY